MDAVKIDMQTTSITIIDIKHLKNVNINQTNEVQAQVAMRKRSKLQSLS